jgi:hypothetical protein
VRVIRGAANDIMKSADSDVIAQIVGQVHTGGTRNRKIEGMGRAFAQAKAFMIRWFLPR